jgi:transposase
MNWTLRSDVVHPDIETLKTLMRKTKDKRMFERYQTVLLHLQGMTYAQIVEIVGRSAVTVGNYVKAQREKGIEGLNMGQSPGRPPFLTNEQEEQLRKLVTEQSPADVGFPSETVVDLRGEATKLRLFSSEKAIERHIVKTVDSVVPLKKVISTWKTTQETFI